MIIKMDLWSTLLNFQSPRSSLAAVAVNIVKMAAVVPATLKAISPYLKTAQEYDKRDAVVAYYCKYVWKTFRLFGKIF